VFGGGRLHRKHVIGSVFPQDSWDSAGGEQRLQHPHGVGFAPDAVEPAEPGIPGPQLFPRLFQDKRGGTLGFDPQHHIRNPPGEGENFGRFPHGQPPCGVQPVQGIVRIEGKHVGVGGWGGGLSVALAQSLCQETVPRSLGGKPVRPCRAEVGRVVPGVPAVGNLSGARCKTTAANGTGAGPKTGLKNPQTAQIFYLHPRMTVR